MGKAAEPDIIKCEPEESAGRIVRIEHYGQYITLCEVQVMGKIRSIQNLLGGRTFLVVEVSLHCFYHYIASNSSPFCTIGMDA